MSAPLRLGTRGSALALAQSGQVASTLTAATGREVELVRVVTRGDTTSVESAAGSLNPKPSANGMGVAPSLSALRVSAFASAAA